MALIFNHDFNRTRCEAVGRIANSTLFGERSIMKIGIEWTKHGAHHDSIERYSVTILRDSKHVRFTFDNSVENSSQNGGFVSLPVEVANRLGHALVLMSSGKEAGVPDMITFKIDETTHES